MLFRSKLEERGGSRYRSASSEYVWRDGGSLNDFDDNKTYYYVPLSGFAAQWKLPLSFSAHEFCNILRNTRLNEFNHVVYGVRKADLPTIQKKKNWVLIEDHVKNTLTTMANRIHMTEVMESLDRHVVFDYNNEKLMTGIASDKSPAKDLLAAFAGLPKVSNVWAFKNLLRTFNIESKVDVIAMVNVYKQKLKDFDLNYPLFTKFGSYTDEADLCEYINLVDKVKGI